MLNQRLDALAVREGKDNRSYFTKIGAAFPNKDGKGYTLMLDAVPASTDGQYKIMLREPLPKDGERSQGKRQSGNDGWGRDDLDDDIRF